MLKSEVLENEELGALPPMPQQLPGNASDAAIAQDAAMWTHSDWGSLHAEGRRPAEERQ